MTRMDKRQQCVGASKTSDDASAVLIPRLPKKGKKLPREMLYVKKFVDLDQYITDFRKRKIIAYARLPPAKRMELFGSTIVPIHVPLARWESAEQYEERFIQWLHDKKGRKLRDLETDANDELERFYRIKFANLNATKEEAFVLPPVPGIAKRGRSVSEERLPKSKKFAPDGSLRTTTEAKATSRETKKAEAPVDESSSACCVNRPPTDASVDATADAFTACGCAQCLVEVMRFLAGKITELDKLVS